MPSIQAAPVVGEFYLCTSVPIPTDINTYYVVGIEPVAKMTRVHHMQLAACETPGLTSTDGSQVCIKPIDIVDKKVLQTWKTLLAIAI